MHALQLLKFLFALYIVMYYFLLQSELFCTCGILATCMRSLKILIISYSYPYGQEHL